MLEQFYEELSQNPGDWKVRSVMADWCEDHDRPILAECLRWMVRHQKRPHSSSNNKFTWFNAERIRPNLGDPESDIPEAIFLHLSGKEAGHHKTYEGLRQAEDDFLNAWTAARSGGWNANA